MRRPCDRTTVSRNLGSTDQDLPSVHGRACDEFHKVLARTREQKHAPGHGGLESTKVTLGTESEQRRGSNSALLDRVRGCVHRTRTNCGIDTDHGRLTASILLDHIVRYRHCSTRSCGDGIDRPSSKAAFRGSSSPCADDRSRVATRRGRALRTKHAYRR